MPYVVGSNVVEMDLSVALSQAQAARNLIEDTADMDDPTKDAEALRRVYAYLIDVTGGIAGAMAVLRMRGELSEAIKPVPALRLVPDPKPCSRHDFRDGDVCSRCDAGVK